MFPTPIYFTPCVSPSHSYVSHYLLDCDNLEYPPVAIDCTSVLVLACARVYWVSIVIVIVIIQTTPVRRLLKLIIQIVP
jgi:hypothetical protein